MTVDPRTLEALRASSLLADLPQDRLEALLAQADEVVLEPGVVLMAEGAEPDGLYVVLDGELAVTKRLDGTEVPVATCGRGEVLGELAVVPGRRRSATVRAVGPARLLHLDVPALHQLLGNPHTALTLVTTMTRRLEELELLVRQHARMATLGTLTAGLLHELNNPAAAVARSVDHLPRIMADWQRADRGIEERQLLGALAHVLDTARPPRSALDRLDTEDRLVEALEGLEVAAARPLAAELAALGLDAEQLRSVLADVDGDQRDAAVRWLALRGRLANAVREARTGAGRISEVVGAVKRYSHVDEAPVQDVDVHEGLEAALTLLRGRIPADVEVLRDYDLDLPRIEGYPGDLNTVWTNLLDNALDAARPRGTVILRTRPDDDGVRVEVENTGPVVPAAVLERVFDPFFTTKPVGTGTGLGLATSYSIVTSRHGGRLTMTSRPGRTVVSARLPARRAVAGAGAGAPGVASGGTVPGTLTPSATGGWSMQARALRRGEGRTDADG